MFDHEVQNLQYVWYFKIYCQTAIKIYFNDLQVHQFIQIITVAHWLLYYMCLTNESYQSLNSHKININYNNTYIFTAQSFW